MSVDSGSTSHEVSVTQTRTPGVWVPSMKEARTTAASQVPVVRFPLTSEARLEANETLPVESTTLGGRAWSVPLSTSKVRVTSPTSSWDRDNGAGGGVRSVTVTVAAFAAGGVMTKVAAAVRQVTSSRGVRRATKNLTLPG